MDAQEASSRRLAPPSARAELDARNSHVKNKSSKTNSVLSATTTPLFASVAQPAHATDSTSGPSSWLENTSYESTTKPKKGSDGFGGGTMRTGTSRKKKEQSDLEKRKRRRTDQPSEPKSQASVTVPDAKPADVFKRDSRPDTANLEFQSMYRSDTPLYSRVSNSFIGQHQHDGSRGRAAQSMSVQWDDGRHRRRSKLVDGRSSSRSARYFSSASMKKVGADTKPLRMGASVGDGESKPETAGSIATSVSDQSFVSLEISEMPRGESYEDWALRKSKEWSKILCNSPNDIELWELFATFQNKVLFPSGSKSSLNERKLALIERALKSNPRSEHLISEYLDLCRLKLDSSEVEEKWKKTIFSHPSSLPLWRDFLAFFTSELSQFQVTKAQSQYHKAIETMSSMVSGSFASHNLDTQVAELAVVDMLSRSMNFQRRAGFGEKALACFQAIIEFAVFVPDDSEIVGKSKLFTMFELFWESECPRFGDVGATGFTAWLELRKMGGQSEQQKIRYSNGPDDPREDLSRLEPWLRWVQLETWREKAHWRQWIPPSDNSIAEEDCDDPDRLVIFDDVAGHLVQIKSLRLQLELIYRFFEFCEVPLRLRLSSNNSYTHDQFLDAEECGLIFAPLLHRVKVERLRHQPSSSEPSRLGKRVPEPADSDYPFGISAGEDQRLWGIGVAKDETNLFRRSYGWIRPAPHGDMSKQNFVIEAFEQIIVRFPADNYLRLNFIDYLENVNRNVARKRLKAMLREPRNRNNLVLLDRYAEIELRGQGGLKDAKKIWGTALTMADSLSQSNRKGHAGLCRHYAEACFDYGDRNGAIRALMMFVLDQNDLANIHDGADIPPTLVAKARRAFASHFPQLENRFFEGDGVDEVACHAYFELATLGSDAAISIYSGVIESISKSFAKMHKNDTAEFAFEQLYEDELHLIQWIGQKQLLPPLTLREPLNKALKLFPGNTRLLTMFIGAESRYRIAGRVRSLFDELIAQYNRSPIVYLFAVYSELAQIHGASPHRVRAIFELAAEDRNARRCPLLWRMWIEFERAQAHHGSLGKTQAVVYRAIQNCPGAKCVYLDGVVRSPSMMQEILDIIQEKGLHLRSPIEELELWAVQDEESNAENLARKKANLELADDLQEQNDMDIEKRIQEDQNVQYERMKNLLNT